MKIRTSFGDDQARHPRTGSKIQHPTHNLFERHKKLTGMGNHLLDGAIAQRAESLGVEENLGETAAGGHDMKANPSRKTTRARRRRALWVAPSNDGEGIAESGGFDDHPATGLFALGSGHDTVHLGQCVVDDLPVGRRHRLEASG